MNNLLKKTLHLATCFSFQHHHQRSRPTHHQVCIGLSKEYAEECYAKNDKQKNSNTGFPQPIGPKAEKYLHCLIV